MVMVAFIRHKILQLYIVIFLEDTYLLIVVFGNALLDILSRIFKPEFRELHV